MTSRMLSTRAMMLPKFSPVETEGLGSTACLCDTAAMRIRDVVAASLGLLLLSPLLLSVGLLISLTSPGSILFRQERIGRAGVPFTILKFRTMRNDAPSRGPAITASGDPRITPVGSVLRRWKLDELPQLINVLRGEMSLVGPRPEVAKYVALYTERQRQVLTLRPGITSAASLQYRNESDLLTQYEDSEHAYAAIVMPEKLRIDLEYFSRRSFWSDLKLIIATITGYNPTVGPSNNVTH